jgi:hypothetical protein
MHSMAAVKAAHRHACHGMSAIGRRLLSQGTGSLADRAAKLPFRPVEYFNVGWTNQVFDIACQGQAQRAREWPILKSVLPSLFVVAGSYSVRLAWST